MKNFSLITLLGVRGSRGGENVVPAQNFQGVIAHCKRSIVLGQSHAWKKVTIHPRRVQPRTTRDKMLTVASRRSSQIESSLKLKTPWEPSDGIENGVDALPCKRLDRRQKGSAQQSNMEMPMRAGFNNQPVASAERIIRAKAWRDLPALQTLLARSPEAGVHALLWKHWGGGRAHACIHYFLLRHL